jgi:hypothetical protein
MAYTTIDDPTAYFQAKTYTGNGGTNAITFDGNSDLSPDFVWLKMRSGADNHTLFNTTSGVGKRLFSNLTQVESTESTSLTAFGSDGFTLGADAIANANTSTFVSWNWKESATAGFDIVAYTGNGSSGLTVSHSLSAIPSVMIIKNRSGDYSWAVYHHKNTSAPETESLFLDVTDATSDRVNEFNDTAPTSSIFTVGDGNSVNNSSENFIAYLFAEKQGYSKFGGYTGNGNADGTFIYTGFKPAFVMVKRTSGTGAFWMRDNKIAPINLASNVLQANDAGAQADGVGTMDFLSNGFKLRDTADASNTSSGTYIYMAFAEAPFVNSNGVPCNAR